MIISYKKGHGYSFIDCLTIKKIIITLLLKWKAFTLLAETEGRWEAERRGKETKTGTVSNIIILLLINDKWELHESP